MSAARLSVEYRGVVELRGPLLVVDEVSGVGWDEYATIRITSDSTASGVRHGSRPRDQPRSCSGAWHILEFAERPVAVVPMPGSDRATRVLS